MNWVSSQKEKASGVVFVSIFLMFLTVWMTHFRVNTWQRRVTFCHFYLAILTFCLMLICLSLQ